MVIKPSEESYATAIIPSIGVLVAWALIVVLAVKGIYVVIAVLFPISMLLTWGVARSVCLLMKTVELCPDGYWVCFCGVCRLYRWTEVKTKRLEDYSKVVDRNFNNARFPEGVIFSVDKKKRPKWMHPLMFCSLTHPFSSFYVCFQVQEKKRWNEYYYVDECVIVDKKELLDTLHSFGVELETS